MKDMTQDWHAFLTPANTPFLLLRSNIANSCEPNRSEKCEWRNNCARKDWDIEEDKTEISMKDLTVDSFDEKNVRRCLRGCFFIDSALDSTFAEFPQFGKTRLDNFTALLDATRSVPLYLK